MTGTSILLACVKGNDADLEPSQCEGQLPRHLDLLDVTAGVNSMCLEQSAKPCREGSPASHRFPPGHEELDVLGHEGKDRLHISLGGSAMPPLDKRSNISFIGGHGSLRFDA